jgi:hypothetical protein
LEATGLTEAGLSFAGFHEITRHVNYRWFVFTGGGENARGGGLSARG